MNKTTFVVYKKNTISLDMLRENVVGKFTQKLWKNKFKHEKIDNYIVNSLYLLQRFKIKRTKKTQKLCQKKILIQIQPIVQHK